MHIAVVGLSHRTAPVEVREKLSIPEQTMPDSLNNLKGNDQILEVSILSTCNRLEIYTLLRHQEFGLDAIRNIAKDKQTSLWEAAKDICKSDKTLCSRPNRYLASCRIVRTRVGAPGAPPHVS